VNVDRAKAAQLFGRAAEQGLAAAQYKLGVCCNLGQGVEVDKAKAVQLFRQAAEQGHGMARWSLGLCHEHGHGVPHDMVATVALYRLAIEGGCVSANASLGLCFEKGGGAAGTRAGPGLGGWWAFVSGRVLVGAGVLRRRIRARPCGLALARLLEYLPSDRTWSRAPLTSKIGPL
jgi:hypothetical protein